MSALKFQTRKGKGGMGGGGASDIPGLPFGGRVVVVTGTEPKTKLTWKRTKYANVSVRTPLLFVLSIVTQNKQFFFRFQSELLMLVRFIPNKKRRKRSSRDVFDTFARHAGLVYDVTDTDYWAHIHCSAHGHVFVTFTRLKKKKKKINSVF